MKYTILVVVFVMMLKPVLPVCNYILNYDFIVKELCENKEKPEMKCNGKCHLMKEMAKNAESEKPLSTKKAHQELEVLFVAVIETFSVKSGYDIEITQVSNMYNNLYVSTYRNRIFHPPSFI